MSYFFSLFLWFIRNKYAKNIAILGSLFFVWMCFWVDTSNSPQFTENELTKNIIEIFDLIFWLMALVLWPMVILAGWLLSPDWTMGDFFGLRGYFKEIWILVSNIVYIVFALMLLYMAIMQIFGGAESEYAFKKKLPYFIVWILIVPFSWLIVSWTLSFANQAVAAVLSIPMGSISKMSSGGNLWEQDTSLWHQKMLPTQFDFFTSGQSGYGSMQCEWGVRKDNIDVPCISPAEFLTKNEAWPFFIIMIYAYNIFKIQDADKLSTKTDFCRGTGENADKYKSAKDCVENLVAIVRDFGLSLIVTLFFAVMLVALCWVLLMRAIKLWIYIMLSPLFWLAYFTWKAGESFGDAWESGFGQVGFKQFFSLAMVPVLVSAVLAFGLLFVGVVRDNFHTGLKAKDQTVFCTEEKVWYMVTYCIEQTPTDQWPQYSSRLIIGTDTDGDWKDSRITLNFWNTFSNIIAGAEWASVLSTAGGAVAGGISSVEDIFAHIILTMMALVFMFMGVKVAVSSDAVTKAAFEPFEKFGNSVGSFVAHSPSYLPLPHASFLSPSTFQNLSAKMDNMRRDHQNELRAGVFDKFDGTVNNAKSAAKNTNSTLDERVETMSKLTSEQIARAPKEISIPNIKWALSSMQSSPQLVELKWKLENVNDHRELQKYLKDNKIALDSVVSSNGTQWTKLREMIDKVSNSSTTTNNNTINRIDIGGFSAPITGDKNWYKIENEVDTFQLPKIQANMTLADDTARTKVEYTTLKTILANWDRLSKAKVNTTLPWGSSFTPWEYDGLSKYLWLNGVVE